MPVIQGTVGPQSAKIVDGAPANGRFGQQSDLIVSELHGPLYEAALRQTLFNGANIAAQATTVALATTYTGLCLSNPVGNTKNLVLLEVAFALSVAPAAIASIGLAIGYNASTSVTHTTPITMTAMNNNFVGVGGIPTGKLDSSATLPTAPLWVKQLYGGFTAAALPASPACPVDLKGRYILVPGAYAIIASLTAVTGLGSFEWAEEPV